MPSKYRNYVIDTNLLRPLTDSRNSLHAIVRAYYSRVNNDCLWIPVVAVVESLRGAVNSIKDSDSDKDAKRKYDRHRRSQPICCRLDNRPAVCACYNMNLS